MGEFEATKERAKPNNFQVWQDEIRAIGVTNPLVNFEPSTFSQIDLDRAHPGGIAQFVGSGSTVLSNLVRDPLAFSRASAAAKRIKNKGETLAAHFGVESIHLLGGLVNFEADGYDLAHPILIWPLRILNKADDFEITVVGPARVNPALIVSLDTCYGVRLNESELLRRLGEHSDLLPIAVLQYLNEITGDKAKLDLGRILVIANATTVPTELLNDFTPSQSPIIQRLASEQAHYEDLVVEASPNSLTLVADADEAQRRVVSRALAGASFAVETLPGCGYTQTVVNLLGALTSAGKRTLVLAPRRQTLNEITDRLAIHGLPGLAVRSSATWLDVVSAISRNEKAGPSNLAQVRAEQSKLSSQLGDYFETLNRSDSELGVSISQVLEQLAALAAMPHAPSTSARIARDKMILNKDRTEALRLLQEAHDLGEFKFGPQDTAWYQAVFASPGEVDEAISLATRLRDEVYPRLSKQLAEFIQSANFRPAESVADWGIYLRLFSGVRETLDRFVPDVYDRPLGELIQATSARKEKGSMSGGTRRRLKKLAKEYLRPGMSITDMHSALLAIEEQREMWARYCTVPTAPRVQNGINDALAAYQGFMADIASLQKHLDPESQELPLSALGLSELQAKLESLSQDTEALANLGERSMVSMQLRDLGLGPLVRDLARLHTAKEHLAIELDQAWWQTALEIISSNDALLLGLSSNQINQLEDKFVSADSQLVHESARDLAFELGQRWRNALSAHPQEAAALKAVLKSGSAELAEIVAASPNIYRVLASVVMMSPYEVPNLLNRGEVFDVVLVLDAAGSTVAENYAGLRRGKQVIAFGDDAIAYPAGFEVEPRPEPLGRETTVKSIFQDVRDHFDSEVLRHSYRTTGQTLGVLINREFYQNRIIFEPTAAEFSGKHNYNLELISTGNRAGGSMAKSVESLDVEVQKTVDLIFNHALWYPEDSLLVATASPLHAERLRTAVSAGLKNRPQLESFFEGHGRERFEISSMSELAHRISDRIIFSIGFGRTADGKVPPDFGQLSAPDGRRALANLLISARQGITIVSCFDADSIPTEGLTGAAPYLRDLLNPKYSTDGDGSVLEQDPMLRDLSMRLLKLGVRVYPNYADRLPLVAAYANQAAVIAPDWALAGDSLSERIRLRPNLLRAMGWNYMRVHSFELFADPQELANRIASSLGIAISKRPQTLFGSDDRAFEDTDLAWGEQSGSNDRRLTDDKPPHWG